MNKRRIDLKDLRTLAKELVVECEKRTGEWATVVALSGDLGAGKTTLTKDVARVLGIKSDITSPTFVIEKIYGLPAHAGQAGLPSKTKSRFARFIHIDAYRLESSRELDVLGWHDIVNDPKNLIFVEWPEHVHEALPENTLWVTLKHVSETVREISWT